MSTEPEHSSVEPPAPPVNGGPISPGPIPGAEKKLVAGLMGILIGWLGIHKFYLGYKTEGIIMLAVGLGGFLLCGAPTLIVSIVGLVEGILYLTKTDEQFVNTYITNKKGWF